jgi:hypothetical protein
MQKLVFCPAVIAVFATPLSWAQATVNESLETSFIYVDVKNGSDNNNGSQSSPFKTIGKAVAIAESNNVANIGTKVIINPGTYREVLTIQAERNQTAKPMTFQAAQNGTVIISGAVQYTGWAPDPANNKIYTATWPNRWGLCAADNGLPLEQDIVMRQEMVLVNATPMTQVLSLSQMIFPGTFYVDETHALVYVWPPAGTNMSAADVEVPTHPQILTVNSSNGKVINGIVFRGLTFAYANSCRKDPAAYITGSVENILFDTDTFMWNNAQGLALNTSVSYVTVLNSTAKHNGAAGFHTWRVTDILWQGTTASYNNWRGAQGAYYTWNTGGFHIFSDHRETFKNVNTTNNQTFGVHWDTDSQNVAVTTLFDSGNLVAVLNEKNEGPLTITNSRFCNSTYSAKGYGGFVLRNSDNTSITNSTFYNNAAAQILITGVAGGFPISNWETGQTYNLITEHLTLTGNTIEGVGSPQESFQDGSLGGTDWIHFKSTLKSDTNTWWNASNPKSFVVPMPRAGTQDTFTGWQTLTAQDLHSKFVAPATNPASACATTADGPDYWLLVDNDVVTTDATGKAVFNITTRSLGGFTGSVTLALDGITGIAGAKATLSANPIPATGTSVLTVTTSATTPKGTHTFTLLANSGNVTRTVVLSFAK